MSTVPSIPYTVEVPLTVFPSYQIIGYISDLLSDNPTDVTNLLSGQDILIMLDTWIRECPTFPECKLTVVLAVMRTLINILDGDVLTKGKVNRDFIADYKANLQQVIPVLIETLKNFPDKL